MQQQGLWSGGVECVCVCFGGGSRSNAVTYWESSLFEKKQEFQNLTNTKIIFVGVLGINTDIR